MNRYRIPRPHGNRRYKSVGHYAYGGPLRHNHYYDYHHGAYVHPTDHTSHWYGGWCWFLFFLLFLAIFIVWIVAYYNHNGYYYYHHPTHAPSRVTSNARVLPKDCLVGEYYDRDIGMCAPKTPVPMPIVTDIQDPHVQPCQSYYHHMCGAWIDAHTNEDRSFTYLYHKNRIQVQHIIADRTSGPAYRLYRSCLDTLVNGMHTKEEELQRRHILEYIHKALTRMQDLPVVLARLARYGLTSPFVFSIERHPTEPTMIPMLRADDFHASLTRDNVTSILGGDAHKGERAWRVISKLRSWRITEEPDDYAAYLKESFENDLYTFEQLHTMTHMKHFWTEYLHELDGHGLEAVRDPTERVWMFNLPYFRNLLGSSTGFTLQEWKDYVEFCIREANSHFFPMLQDNVYFKKHDVSPFGPHVFLEHRLKRKIDVGPSEALCMDAVHKLLPGVVAKEFLHRYFEHDEEHIRTQVTQVVTNIRDTFVQFIQETEWMDQATKHEAIGKLRNIIVRVIHPNTFGEEPFAERISQTRWLRNLNLIRQHRVHRNMALWGSRDPLDRDVIQRFGMPLNTVNAYYSPITNTITVFAGILRPPFYDPEFSLDAVYARIGSIVGHEMSHALDNHGRLWDQNGSFRNWWTPSAKRAFDDRAQCVMDEYPAPQGCDNPNYGEQTLGENLSDGTGIMLAYRAYFENTAEGRTKKRHEKQYWWQMFAQMWCETMDEASMCYRVNSDVHAIGEMRVDRSLRQLRVFHTDYQCKAQDQMVNEEACIVYGKK